MGETVTLNISLRAFVRKVKKNLWVAICPRINVASQGSSSEDAMRCLREAIGLWFESCVERGVLDQAMRESAFRPVQAGEVFPDDAETVLVGSEIVPDDDDVLGNAFPITIAIPAYQAAAFLNT